MPEHTGVDDAECWNRVSLLGLVESTLKSCGNGKSSSYVGKVGQVLQKDVSRFCSLLMEK